MGFLPCCCVKEQSGSSWTGLMQALAVLVAWPWYVSSSSSSSSLSSSSSVSLVVRLPPVACVWQTMFTDYEEALAFFLAVRPHTLRCPDAPLNDTRAFIANLTQFKDRVVVLDLGSHEVITPRNGVTAAIWFPLIDLTLTNTIAFVFFFFLFFFLIVHKVTAVFGQFQSNINYTRYA